MLRVLGVDPGSRLTGYGCVDVVGNQLRHVTDGTLKLASTSGRATVPAEQRLLLLYQGLSEIIQKHRPTVMVVEKVFFAKNAVSALKLGQARGVILLCGAAHGIDVVEYSPTEVKQAVVGHGQADKHQVAKMVQLLIGKREFATVDASDGLALAICHAHSAMVTAKMGGHRGNPETTAALEMAYGRKSKKRNLSLAEAVGIASNPSPSKVWKNR